MTGTDRFRVTSFSPSSLSTASNTVMPSGTATSVTLLPWDEVGEDGVGCIIAFGVQPTRKSQPPARPVASTTGWSMYAFAICWRFCARSAIVVFLQEIIVLMFAAGFGAFGSGLQPERSESLAGISFGFPPATVSAYTVTSRFSVCVFNAN